MHFTGNFRHSLDGKGRLTVPSRVRDELEETKVTLLTWSDGCIALWCGAPWAALSERLNSVPKNDRRRRALVREMFSQGHRDEVDNQGRITIPPNLREHAGIDRDVLIVGNGDHVELWDPARYEESRRPVMEAENFDDVFAELGL